MCFRGHHQRGRGSGILTLGYHGLGALAKWTLIFLQFGKHASGDSRNRSDKETPERMGGR